MSYTETKEELLKRAVNHRHGNGSKGSYMTIERLVELAYDSGFVEGWYAAVSKLRVLPFPYNKENYKVGVK